LYQKRYWLAGGLLKTFGFGATAFFMVMLIITAIDQSLTSSLVLDNLVTSVCFGLAMIVVIPLASFISMRFAAPRTFEQVSLGLPVTYEMDETGLSAANAKSTTNLVWGDLTDFVQDRRLLLLRRTRRIFFPLPKSQLDQEQLSAIFTLLREGGVPQG
jgi:hypothetical protein